MSQSTVSVYGLAYDKSVCRMLFCRSIQKYSLLTVVVIPLLLMADVSQLRVVSSWVLATFIGALAYLGRGHYRDRAFQLRQ